MLLDTISALQKRHGKHYTPAPLADFLAERLLAQISLAAGALRVLDPACGDGELLLALARVARRKNLDVALELVGFDLDAEAIQTANGRAAALGVPIAFECANFLVASDLLIAASFDGVISNPPYVRTQQLGRDTAQLLAEKYGLSGRIDLTHPFVSIAPNLLRPGGVLALLCSNRFLSTKAGSNMREIFSKTLSPVELYDLGDTKIFGAAVLPAVLIAIRQQNTQVHPRATFLSAYESDGPPDAPVDLFEALSRRTSGRATWDGRVFDVKAGTLTQGASGSTPWRMGGTDEAEWLARLDAGTWKTFGQIAKIRVGVKTTADSVFIRDSWGDLPLEQRPEEALLQPLTTHHNIARWRFDPGALSVLYPYRLDVERRTVPDMEQYPRAMAYLESHRERLEGRKYVTDAGRQWFEIWVAQQPGRWKSPKLVFPDISELPRFALDRSGAIVNGDCYWIAVDDIGSSDLALLMLGVANSSTAVRFYDHVCGNKLYAGRRRWISQYVSLFPIPEPSSVQSLAVVEFVRSLVEGERAVTEEVAEELDQLVIAAFETKATRADVLF
ncbi:DNA methyltransferase [Rathayibacter rathayi]|uniref:Eco57I restriction-modification methylase domain-containing protein n=1 Tax=Rathayibacter rathayi TaxID=33887 RepID=UPI000CE84134|nr:methyltransferase domain-containing protein [Rathayibacter rathayi]PPI74853.1 DNA methyltransferase [Rathayibacter rathayi]